MRDGELLLSVLKRTAINEGPHLSLLVGKPQKAILRPLSAISGNLSDRDVQFLTEWRNRFPQAFLTEFQATPQRTRAWLTGPVAQDNGKILFMAEDTNQNVFGYLGLDAIDWAIGYGEADAIVRGLPTAPGLMQECLRTLLAWAYAQLGLQTLAVRVLSDNAALHFYEKCGFRETKRIPLRRTEGLEIIEWREDPSEQNPSRYLVHLEFDRSTLSGVIA